MGIHHYTTSVYHPEENGLFEVFSRTLKHGVQTFGDTPWEVGLKQLLKSYRQTPSSYDGKSPVEKFLQRPIRPDWAPNTSRPKRRIHQGATDERTPVDAFIAKPWSSWSLYKVGDLVLVKVPWVPKGNPPWKGPFKVERALGSFSFRLEGGRVWNDGVNAKMEHWVLWRPEQEQCGSTMTSMFIF